MTVSDYVTAALRMIGVLGETDSPSAEQGSDAVTVLNDMFGAWEADDINIGGLQLGSTTDTLDIHPQFREAVKTALAMRLATHYSRQPPPALVVWAADAYSDLLQKMMDARLRESSMWSVPRGTGNLRWGFNITTGNL